VVIAGGGALIERSGGAIGHRGRGPLSLDGSVDGFDLA
jgi:hypothetical protein